MNERQHFISRWASSPGETIRNAILSRDWSVERLAAETSLDEEVVLTLLDGSTPMTVDLANRLAATVGGTARFWLSRDVRYREQLEWVEADRWTSMLPLSEMARMGWIEDRPGDWKQRVLSSADFFGLDSVGDLRKGGIRLAQARYRSTPETMEQQAAVAAWVRRVEIEAQDSVRSPWSVDGLRDVLPEITALSRIADPTVFVPELQRICAEVGFAVAVVRPPSGCPVSGVAMSLESGERVIGLSGRFMSDDHFWFTFMHEVAHLVLHDDPVCVDDIDLERTRTADDKEVEADELASRILLPDRQLAALGRDPSPMAIHGLGVRAGVANGVIVGQLQHAGLVAFNSRLNRLKHRYAWDGTVMVRRTA
jgi:plasmid maintenance system antidote protein VapI